MNEVPQGVPLSQRPVSAQEVFVFLSDPRNVIARAKRAFLGNCEFVIPAGKTEPVLIEWIVQQTPEGEFKKTWVSPPISPPLVRNYSLWQTIESMLTIYCSPYYLLNNPEEPEDLATTIGIGFQDYLADNFETFNLDIPSAHAIHDMVSDLIAAVLKGSEGKGIQEILTHSFQVSIDEKGETPQAAPKPLISFGGGK